MDLHFVVVLICLKSNPNACQKVSGNVENCAEYINKLYLYPNEYIKTRLCDGYDMNK